MVCEVLGLWKPERGNELLVGKVKIVGIDKMPAQIEFEVDCIEIIAVDFVMTMLL